MYRLSIEMYCKILQKSAITEVIILHIKHFIYKKITKQVNKKHFLKNEVNVGMANISPIQRIQINNRGAW